jgi:hypothetical protein
MAKGGEGGKGAASYHILLSLSFPPNKKFRGCLLFNNRCNVSRRLRQASQPCHLALFCLPTNMLSSLSLNPPRGPKGEVALL